MRFLIYLFVLLICIFEAHSESGLHRYTCSSPIYCEGELLHLVQTAKIFNDSKSFVDMTMMNPVEVTLERFDIFLRKTNQNPSKAEIRQFVFENFKTVGEMEDVYPSDYQVEPPFVKEISNNVVAKFAKGLIALWPTLARRVSQKVFDNPDTHSIIPLKHPFIVPGGRFREIYYWDTYWIIKGLLLSDMIETAKGMIENLLEMVEKYGFVPNGGRIYYINRSQPPVLSLMMSDYIQYTKDYEFLRKHIRTLEIEMEFWLTRRTTEVEQKGFLYKMAHFDAESDTPRAESYFEDIETCAVHKTKESMHECYTELKSGAESGWDFTTRWLFNESGDPTDDLSKIATRRNLPVDLNSFLYRSFTNLAKFHIILRNNQRAKFWLDISDQWKKGIEDLMYNEEDGIWYDYDLKLKKQRRMFAASNFSPLWAGALDEHLNAERSKRALLYLKKQDVLNLHGIPATKILSGQQWDFPNAWSPYQNIIIFGLHKCGDEFVQNEAKNIAHKWVNSNIKAFNTNKVMFEKYNSEISGHYGGGGEYQIQAGFGWTNGSILEIIDFYFRTKTRKYLGLDN